MLTHALSTSKWSANMLSMARVTGIPRDRYSTTRAAAGWADSTAGLGPTAAMRSFSTYTAPSSMTRSPASTVSTVAFRMRRLMPPPPPFRQWESRYTAV